MKFFIYYIDYDFIVLLTCLERPQDRWKIQILMVTSKLKHKYFNIYFYILSHSISTLKDIYLELGVLKSSNYID
jgi:hypothetical protein